VKTRMSVGALGLLLTPIVLIVSQGTSEACSCPPEPAAAEALQMVDAVFEGTIVDQRAVLAGDQLCTGVGVEYDVIVRRAWKGVFERRVKLVRAGVCSPSFRVGSTALIYANRHHGELTVCGCMPTKDAANAASDIAQFSSPLVTFEGRAIPVATSLPLSRRIRAYILAGISVYASYYAWWPDIEPGWDILLSSGAIILQALAALVFLVRRRVRLGACLFAGSAATTAITIFWLGHMLLRSDWYSPLLTW
jgi:hypothetical protein